MLQVAKDLAETGTLPPAFRAQCNCISNEKREKATQESAGQKTWHIETGIGA